jgi:hypothetical protein
VFLPLALAIVLLGLSAWLGACMQGSDRQKVADDAYITFTYARNWVEGHGLRFNPSDESATPGCSTELHLLASAAAIRAGLDPLVATRGLSLLGILGLGVMFGLAAARSLRVSPALGLMAGAAGAWALLLLPETVVHLSSGMETLLFALAHAAVFTWVALAAAAEKPPGALRLLIGAPVFAALVSCRPEGWMLAVLYAAALAVARYPRDGALSAVRDARSTLALVLAVVAGYFVWRWSSFGSLLANPYYVKSSNAIFGSSGALLPGLAEVFRFAVLRLLPAAVLAGLLGSYLRLESRVWLPLAALLAPSVCVLLLYTRVIHEMAGGFRYEYPMLVPWIGVGVAGLAALSLRSRRSLMAAWFAVVFVVPAFAASARPRVWDYAQHLRSSAVGWLSTRPADNALSRAGRDLEDSGLGEQATVLLSAAGQIPWYSRLRAIDWVGLNNTHLSGREALTLEQVWQYIGAQNPDLVQSILPPAAQPELGRELDPNFRSENVRITLGGRGSGLFEHWNQERLRAMFWSEMTFVRENCVFGACYKLGDAWGDDWWVFLYVRKDSPHKDRLLDVLRRSTRTDKSSDLGRVFAFDPRRLGE